MKVIYVDRETKEKKEEKIYGEKAIRFLYGEGFLRSICRFFCSLALFAAFYGFWQKQKFTKKKIKKFIADFSVDTSEFLNPVDHFSSFNDFFCRKLKPQARPIDPDDSIAIIPADGRYLVYPNLSECDGFFVKGEKFSLRNLLKDDTLTEEYHEGAIVLGRLCPVDYHRFHFPTKGIPEKRRLINGFLFSVNPIALVKNSAIFTQNKREITIFSQTPFGKILFIEVGATCVGTIHQTYKPNTRVQKGDEKGYFSFGGSLLILLFKQGTIDFSEDLLHNSANGLETFCKMGQPLGRKIF